MNLGKALTTITEEILNADLPRVIFYGNCTQGRHDGHIVKITVDVLCGCDRCMFERVAHDEIVTGRHHELHELGEDEDEDKDDQEEDPNWVA